MVPKVAKIQERIQENLCTACNKSFWSFWQGVGRFCTLLNQKIGDTLVGDQSSWHPDLFNVNLFVIFLIIFDFLNQLLIKGWRIKKLKSIGCSFLKSSL